MSGDLGQGRMRLRNWEFIANSHERSYWGDENILMDCMAQETYYKLGWWHIHVIPATQEAEEGDC